MTRLCVSSPGRHRAGAGGISGQAGRLHPQVSPSISPRQRRQDIALSGGNSKPFPIHQCLL